MKDAFMKRTLCIIGAIIYLISPIDFFPEIIFGPFGYIDDLLIIMAAFGVKGAEEPAPANPKAINPPAPRIATVEVDADEPPARITPSRRTEKVAAEAAERAVAKALASLTPDQLKAMLQAK